MTISVALSASSCLDVGHGGPALRSWESVWLTNPVPLSLPACHSGCQRRAERFARLTFWACDTESVWPNRTSSRRLLRVLGCRVSGTKTANLSQADLAERVGLTRASSRISRLDATPVGAHTAMIADILDVPVEDASVRRPGRQIRFGSRGRTARTRTRLGGKPRVSTRRPRRLQGSHQSLRR